MPRLQAAHTELPMPSSEPIIWQFSLSTVNAIMWVALLLLALWFGFRLRWGRLVALVAFLTFDLIVFGGFVRLTDSGLGCPDWPGCYGQLLPAQASAQINQAIAEQGGTHGPVSHGKAWIEMLHRYLASFIGALILVMFVRALLAQRRRSGATLTDAATPVNWYWPALLLVVVIAQGMFGKWTVTLKLMPIVVTAHLMGGMLLLAMLLWFWTRQRQREGDTRAMTVAVSGRTRVLAWLALAVLTVQIFLGGWVSTNYAVLACADFPGCNGSLTPQVDWAEGFAFARALGRNPDGSFLSIEALRAIHWAHRWGALITTVVVIAAALALMRAHAALRQQAILIKLVLLAQIGIGIATVLLDQPIVLATAHNAMAALLLATLVVATCRVSGLREWQPFAISTNLRKQK
ncbi:MAG: COX15/CtaA family protein [Burkholderiales bacterium]|uniref:COX15/CtaA family protein n=2 Tax=Casimicrobium huifangae TaxID=2591109 RepID=UPI0012EC8215|nr:COX15/CtaA family protein [Casimicrobium huifangae]HOB00885.1 COX15/CtaA family protein [Casimicrobium huifangae]